MATLQQTLRGLPQADDQLIRGPGGILQRAPTLQGAAQRAGLTAPPTTPLAAEMTGAGPQAAKMAGTPQQMKAALEATSEPAPTLQTTLRRKQYGRDMTQAEMGAMAKSADMQKLGSLGDRVTTMIQDEYTKATAATAPAAPAGTAPTPDVQISTAGYFEGKDLKSVTPDLQKLQATQPGTEEYNKLLINLNTQLGYGPQFGKELLTADQLQSMYKATSEVLGEGLAGKIRDLSTVKAEEFLPALGYDAASLGKLLGVTPQDIQKYSLADLQDKVNEVTSKEFTKAQQLEQQAMSPLVGVAERGLAREAARELSTTGIRATEADVQKLADEVTAASNVTFMGQTKSIDNWLADDEISAMIKDVVESPAGSKLRSDLKKASPQLSDFIERNEGALKVAAEKLQTGASQFKQLQEKNKKLILDAGLSEDAAKTFADKILGLQYKEFTETDVPILGYLKGLSDTDRQKVSNELNTISVNDPTLAKEVAALSSEQLESLGIGTKGSNWEKMNAYNNKLTQIQNTPTENYDELIREAFSDVGSLDTIKQRIADGNKLKALGLNPGISTFSLDPKTLKEDLLKDKKRVSAVEAAAGTVPQVAKKTFGTPTIPSGEVGSIINKLGPLLEDGNLSAQDFATAYDKNNPISTLNLDEMIALENLSKKPNTSIDQTGATTRRKYLSNIYTRDLFNSTKGTDTALQASMKIINNHGMTDNQKIDRELLSGFVDKEIGDDAEKWGNFVKSRGGRGNLDKMFSVFVDDADKKANDAMRYGVATPRIQSAWANMQTGTANDPANVGKQFGEAYSGGSGSTPTTSQTKSSQSLSQQLVTAAQNAPAQAMKEVSNVVTAVAKPVANVVTSVAAPVAQKTEQVVTSGAKKTEAFGKNLKKGKIKL